MEKMKRMKWSITLLSALIAVVAGLVGCDDGNDGVTVEPIMENCAMFSGTYNGSYNETDCHGTANSGIIENFVVADACSLGIQWTGVALESGGKIYNVTDSSFDITIPKDYTGCGVITGHCLYTTNTVNCEYSYSTGGGGVLDLTKN
jgi:hypothetical protein